MTATGKYQWIDELEAYCLTIAVGADLAAVETAFKIVPESRKLTTVAEYWDTFGKDSAGGNDVVQINSLGNAVIAFESNGWTGADYFELKTFAQIKCPIYVSIFRNVNAAMSFVLARNGELVREFDPLLYDDGGVALPEESAYVWGVDRPNQSALALAEKLTGIEITREWLLGQAHPTYRTLNGNG